MKKILVISPHPDDEAIGCGGSILNHIRKKNEVYVLFMSYFGTKIREIESRKVKSTFGLKEVKFLGISEPIEYSLINVKKLIKEIRRIQPDLIYVPHEEESDRDHRKTNEIFKEAIWMASSDLFSNLGKPNKKHSTIVHYEVHKPLNDVNYYEDISEVLDEKRKMINIYQSQIKRKDYTNAIIGLNRFRGIMGSGFSYAEAFKIKKWTQSL